MTLRWDTSELLDEGNYVKSPQPKSLVVLHHTVGGSARGTLRYWKQDPRRIATAFVVERDGVVWKAFEADCWASHLGVKGGPADLERRSVGIELASEGALRSGAQMNSLAGLIGKPERFDPGLLYGYDVDAPPGDLTYARAVYVIGKDAGEYVEYPAGYRGYRWFDAYEEAQVAATIELVGELCGRFGIPVVVPRDAGNPTVKAGDRLAWRGVLHHACVRPDKSDLHPAFPWDRLARELGGRFE